MALLKKQYDNGDPLTIDTPYACLYCIVMALWSTALMEAWKRKQHEIAHLWDMTSNERDDSVRPEFKADIVIDSHSKQVRRINTARTRLRRFLGEIPIATVSVSIVIACFVGNLVFTATHTSTEDSVGSSVISAVIIIVLDQIYRHLAVMMAKWENHKYQEDFEDSLISKNFVFQFVNSNITLFSIAFYYQSFNKLG